MPIDVAIIDDNNFLIKSIKERLSLFDNIRISFTANDGEQCLTKLATGSRVDLLLMDIEMPFKNGIQTTLEVKKKHPQLKIIVLTVFDDDDNIYNAIQAGADGYLLKETAAQPLYDAIVQTLDGGAAMAPDIAMKILKLLRNPPTQTAMEQNEVIALTAREIEVLEQLSKGLTYTAIAENLFISPSTVRRHIENIYQKLEVHSKIEAIELAKRKRII